MPSPTDTPMLVLAAQDLDVLETLLALGPHVYPVDLAAPPSLAHGGDVEVLDVENTPLARLELGPVQEGRARVVAVEALRPLASVPGELGRDRITAVRAHDRAARDVVVVHRAPLRGELAALAVTRPVWVVPARRSDQAGEHAVLAAQGVRAELGAGRADGDVVVVPDLEHGTSGALRPAEPGLEAVLAAFGFDAPVARVGKPAAPGADPLRTALMAAYDDGVAAQLAPRRAERAGTVVLLTGLSGSGKSTVARALAARLAEEDGREVTLLDGDEVRQMLSAGLGFDRASRELNVTRIGYVASLVARHGGVALAAPIAPFASTRAEVRRRAEDVGDFLLVYVSTPLEVCEARDRKGLYARARAGEVAEFTGISSPYEVPQDADVTIDTSVLSVEEAVEVVLEAMRSRLGEDV